MNTLIWTGYSNPTTATIAFLIIGILAVLFITAMVKAAK